MTFENFTLKANGQTFSGWKRVELHAALNEAARKFEFEVTEIGADLNNPTSLTDWHFPPNCPVKVYIGSDLWADGYSDDYEPSGSKSDHRIIFRGRAKGADFADGSVDHPTGQFEDQKLEQIAKSLDKAGVGVTLDKGIDTGPAIKIFRTRKNATQFAEVLRLCQQRKLTLKGQADGSVLITRAGTTRHSSGFVQGVNLEQFSAKVSARSRFSDYIVLGQDADLYDEDSAEVRGEATDENVTRTRPKIIAAPGATNQSLANQRAEWEMARAAGNMVKAELTSPSCRDSGGMLWEPGFLVYVRSPWIHLDQDMLIEAVDFSQDDSGGTQARVTAVDPASYGGPAPGADNSSPMWD